MQVRAVLITLAALFVALIAAAPTTSPADVEKRSGGYSGKATWYDPALHGGPRGACGGVSINKNMAIVALNSKQYGNMSKDSNWCKKKIKITGPNGSAEAQILDACPECSYGDLDLTPTLFKKIVGDLNIGIGHIKWETI